MRIAIISDVHENLIGLEKAIQRIEAKNCDKIVCLGDIVGMCMPYYSELLPNRNASKVLSIIEDKCEIVVKGNHDLYATKSLPNYSEFEYSENWYQMDYSEKKRLAEGKVRLYEENELDALLGKKELELLSGYPEYETIEFSDNKLLFSHFLYPDLSGSLIDSVKDKAYFRSHFEFMKTQDCLISFVGHTHFKMGAAIAYQKENSVVVPFDSSEKIKLKRSTVVCPSLVRAKAKGFIIFDTDQLIIECIKI